MSSGLIVGVPRQTRAHVAETLQLLMDLPLAGCSVSPFVAGGQTPFASVPNFCRMIRADGDQNAIPTTNMSDSEKPKTTSAPACKWLDQADDFTRREPAKAVVSAFSAGVLLNLLPIGAIVGAVVNIAFALARPALLFFGLFKLWDVCPCKKESKV